MTFLHFEVCRVKTLALLLSSDSKFHTVDAEQHIMLGTLHIRWAPVVSSVSAPGACNHHCDHPTHHWEQIMYATEADWLEA